MRMMTMVGWYVVWDDDGRQWMLAGYGGVDDNDNDGGVDVVGELAVGCCWLNVRRMLAGSGGILAGNGGGPDSQWVRVRGCDINAAGQKKPEAQWTADERKAANLDQRLKSLIMFVLPNDQMNSVINCLIAKSTWEDLILYHEGPSDVKESRVMNLKLCYNTFKFKEEESLTQTFTRFKSLMNELVNDGIKLSKLEINTGFINGLPKKWLSFCQSLRNTNHVKDSKLAYLFGKLKYEENLTDNIYETEKNKYLVSSTPLSTAFFSTSIVQDFQDSPDAEEDTRSSHEYLNDLEEEYQTRALLDKSKRFFKKGTQRFSGAKATNQTECHKCGKKGHYARHSHLQEKNKGLIAETYDYDDEEVSSDENEVTEVKALMALTDEERVSVGKESARNDDWTKISIKRNLVQELNTCKEQLLVLKQAKLDLLTMQHVNTEILKENQNLRLELKELTSITETCLNSSNKVNQCINEQIPTQNKKILGINHLTEDTSSFRSKDSSQRNITDPSVVVSDSSTTDYDSADESSVCSTPILSLKKLDAPARDKSSSASKTNSAPVIKLKNVKMEDDHPLAIVIKELNELKLQISKKKNVHTTSDHNDIEWFRKRETLQAKNVVSFKASKNDSSSALRSKTPTKSEYFNGVPSNKLGLNLNGKAICETQLIDQANPEESYLIATKRTFLFLILGL
ncbi:hypothetical protein Tco_1201294 [Tanacetum coccineum]